MPISAGLGAMRNPVGGRKTIQITRYVYFCSIPIGLKNEKNVA
jgi:hypothetical protein